jgi:hypothetical protein
MWQYVRDGEVVQLEMLNESAKKSLRLTHVVLSACDAASRTHATDSTLKQLLGEHKLIRRHSLLTVQLKKTSDSGDDETTQILSYRVEDCSPVDVGLTHKETIVFCVGPLQESITPTTTTTTAENASKDITASRSSALLMMTSSLPSTRLSTSLNVRITLLPNNYYGVQSYDNDDETLALVSVDLLKRLKVLNNCWVSQRLCLFLFICLIFTSLRTTTIRCLFL